MSSSLGARKRKKVSSLRNTVSAIDPGLLLSSVQAAYGRRVRESSSDPLPYVGFAESLTAVPRSTVFFDSTSNLLSDEIVENERYFPEHPLRHRKTLARAEKRLSKNLRQSLKLEAGVHLFGEYDRNYFHWLVEVLPRVLAIQPLISDAKSDFGPIVIDSELPAQHYEALRLLIGNDVEVLRTEGERLVFSKVWLYSSPPNRVNDVFDRPYLSEFMHIDNLTMRALSDFFTTSVGGDRKASRLLFVRRPEKATRLPINQDLLMSELITIGFEVVSPETMSFVEQVQLFQSAKIVVAPSGAALANILWMRPGTDVFLLAPNHPYKTYHYWESLAACAGCTLRILWQDPVSPIHEYDEDSWHSDYNVNIASVIRSIKE